MAYTCDSHSLCLRNLELGFCWRLELGTFSSKVAGWPSLPHAQRHWEIWSQMQGEKQRWDHAIGITHNNQKAETTQMSIDGWMDKQNVIHPYNGVLFSLKKEWTSATCYNIDELQIYCAKWNKPDTKAHVIWCHLYEVPGIGKFVKT